MATKRKDIESVPSDLDIMMFLDGELESAEAERVKGFLEADEDAQAKATSLQQITDLMQASIELDADDAASKLAGLWTGIEAGISQPVPTPVAEQAEAKATDALVAKASSSSSSSSGAWFGAWQSHIMTGAFVAVAVAVLMIATRPDPVATQETAIRRAAPVVVVPSALASQEPEVEQLEVYEGSGIIMMMPGGDADGEAASTVIWISSDDDLVEDPI